MSARAAFQPFTTATVQGEVSFAAGSLVIPVAGQALQGAALLEAVTSAAREAGVQVHALSSGRSREGIDLGSDGVKALRKPAVALVMGRAWPPPRSARPGSCSTSSCTCPPASWTRSSWAKCRWTATPRSCCPGDLHRRRYHGGGCTEALGAGRWFTGDLRQCFEVGDRTKLADGEKLGKDEETADESRRAFGDQRDIAAIERVSGNILSADVDISHPLAFGVPRRQLAVNKENTVALQPSANPFSTVVRIDTPPRVNGYLSERNRARVAGSAWLLVSAQGQGQRGAVRRRSGAPEVLARTDRLLINAIFFGNLVNPSKARG